MPWVARDADSGERVDLTHARLPEHLPTRRWTCPQCTRTLYLRRSPRGVLHFVHTAVCSGWLGTHPESEAHLAAKSFFAAWLREAWPGEAGVRVELEAAVPEAGRVADVLATFSDGWRLAIEIQLAGAPPAELADRTTSYRRCAIDAVWVLGRRADTAGNREWCRQQYGFSTFVRFREPRPPGPEGDPPLEVVQAWVDPGDLIVLRQNLIGLRRWRQWLGRQGACAASPWLANEPAWLRRWAVALFSLSGHR
jgi:hypothetical protein